MFVSAVKPSPSAPSTRIAALQRAVPLILKQQGEYASRAFAATMEPDAPPVDELLAGPGDAATPRDVFNRLRWGGQWIYISQNRAEVAEIARRFNHQGGFILEHGPASARSRFLGLALPWLTRCYHYLIARKTLLVPPGESSDRFTYHVELLQHATFGSDYVVMKQVPEYPRVLARLREKFPGVREEELERRARKFTDRIFPVFLTRETAMLRILQERLPEPYRSRVPRVIGVEKDANGFIRTLYMNWLRNGVARRPLSQLEFAMQAADLLRAIHDIAGLIHLDLRLDNIVITPGGVGFVDFGSAVRVGECLHESPMLSSLYEEMMRTSQIQRLLGKMQLAGQVTSAEIRNCYQRVDKAVDFFYLAVQINAPLNNPDFHGLVTYDRESQAARQIATLTGDILRPADPEHPPYRSAHDILQGLKAVEDRLSGAVPRASHAA